MGGVRTGAIRLPVCAFKSSHFFAGRSEIFDKIQCLSRHYGTDLLQSCDFNETKT